MSQISSQVSLEVPPQPSPHLSPQVSRYHPLLVTLHWLLAVLIIAALALGALVMVKVPNTDPMKIETLRHHTTGGFLILVARRRRPFIATARPPTSRDWHSAWVQSTSY